MPSESLNTWFVGAATVHPSRPALVTPVGKEDDTWDGLNARVARLRGALQARGVKPGDRVAAWMPRGSDEVALVWAVWGLAAVWVSLPHKLTAAQARWQANDAEPVLMVGDTAACTEFGRERTGLPVVDFAELEATTAKPCRSIEADPGSLAALAYTSGSTGWPKGVMISHRNLCEAAERIDAYLRHRPEDRLLGLMPLSSPWGMLQCVLAARAGAAVVQPPLVALPGEMAATIRAAGVTGMAALPPTWVQLSDWLIAGEEILPGLRYVTTSGGLIPERVWSQFVRVFPRAEVFATYGLTEAFRTTVVPAGWFARKVGSIGRPCPGVEIVLIGEDNRPGETGELVHHGTCVTSGYWRRPQETEKAYAPRPQHAALFAPGERVHYSGDMVKRDGDGFLWFVARRDAQIKTGGFRVSAEEIEAAVLASGCVRQAVVFGVPHETLGQALAAVIEPQGEPEGAKAELLRHLRTALASHQIPRHFHLASGPWPLTANGKVDRLALIAAAKIGLGIGT